MSNAAPRPPTGLKPAGHRLWKSITDEFELAEHELALLVEAVRAVDVLDALDAIVRREGVMDTDGRAHPAAVEQRQQRIGLARVLAALRLPSGDEDAARPQRRGAPRGVYALPGGPARPRRLA